MFTLRGINTLIVVVLIFLSAVCRGQNIEYRHVIKYTTQNGLSSYNVRKINKDRNGYLWVGTQYGLSRFDGRQFVNYSKNASPRSQLCGVDVREVIEDTDHSMLWTLPGEAGFNGIDLKTLTVTSNRPINYKGVEEFGMSMALLRNKLWMGSSTGLRIFDIVHNQFAANVEEPPDFANHHNLEAHLLFTDSYRNLWCFYSWYGIVIYDGGTNRRIGACPLSMLHDVAGAGNMIFNSCVSLDSNTLLVGTNQGLRKIRFDAKSYGVRVESDPCKGLPSLNTGAIEAVARTGDGGLMVASHNELFVLGGDLTGYTILKEEGNSADGDWLSSVQCIFIDGDGNTWLGCQQGLAFIAGAKSPFHAVCFDKATNSTLDHVRSIHILKNGDILAGLRNGLARIDRKSQGFSIIDRAHLYNHIYEDKNGVIHGSTRQGMCIYADGAVKPVGSCYPELAPHSADPVNSDLFVGDSVIILGTENEKGILVWNYRRHAVRQIDNLSATPLASSVVNNMYRDGQERLWVLSDHVISIMTRDFGKANSLSFFDTASKKEINLFFDMCEANGSYWIAAYGTGIIQLDTFFKIKRVFNTGDGLSDNGVYQVFCVHNRLVITSDNGLSVLDLNTFKFKRYYSGNGLHSNSFEEVAGTMRDGLIYAGGVKGFTIIDPSKFTDNAVPPKIYINRVFIDRPDRSGDIDTTNLELRELDVPNDVLQTTLYFSGINYSNPEHTTFAYRIAEKNADWVNIGTQNYINIIGLSHGDYHVEVRAANEDGVWSEPVTMELVYLPKWYETWWFTVLLALVAVGGGYGLYRVRINQIYRQQKIRRDVASDLHDDIGSSLNSVKIFAHMAKASPLQPEYIGNVVENLEHATMGLRDMIWVLDDKRDSVSDLLSRLALMAGRPAEAMGIAVHFEIADEIGHTVLAKPVKRNLFLITKECLNNSVKYAGCRNIWVKASLQSKKLTLSIKDDGRGFDTAATTEGYGLANIKSRANQINFSCVIGSDSSGTEIILSQKAKGKS